MLEESVGFGVEQSRLESASPVLVHSLLPSVHLNPETSLAQMPWFPKLHTPQLCHGDVRAFQEEFPQII